MKITSISPRGDRVVISKFVEETTPGGIYLPPAAQEVQMPHIGTIVSVGPGLPNTDDPERKPIPIGLKEGDLVLFAQYAGTDVEIDEEKLFVMREGDILAVLGADGR